MIKKIENDVNALTKTNICIFVITILIICSLIKFRLDNKNDNSDEKSISDENELFQEIPIADIKPYEPINLSGSVLCHLDELDEITIQLLPYPSYDEYDLNHIFYSYTIYNKYGIQIYNDGFLNATDLPYNITLKMPPNPPYLFFTQCYGNVRYIADWSKVDFEVGKSVLSTRINYEISVNKSYSKNYINFNFNESTICWNFFGINTNKSDFYGSFKIKDPWDRIQIIINHSLEGYDLYYNHGARFPVQGIWSAILETYDKGNANINFPIGFVWMPKKILQSRGFTFI